MRATTTRHHTDTEREPATTARNARLHLVDVLQRISVHPAKHAIELTPRMWKSLFADAPMRSDLGASHHDPPPH